ncbi:coiled-coil domain-containing protein 50 isoform X2 [Alosa sapidissima]|uniref:coiled-coil domain-containing protein 50 isoform X2 n=1 Tax=Alosa sapidissima TaxID=34773 RepID=UPI001C08F6D3|nr:coiled-coil domain-containing protein 50 isoform X2 [Alosa sapidissima]
MADFSIDQENLPGVKEVCRDFAVLEDHCLAHNLQEQEIESHLASNINRSRLVQQDLLVAKRLQEEEDLRAKEKKQQQHQELEQIDSEIAQVIQEQLVRQAEQQRQQEEKDAAIARKLQEKEEKRRQKQLETKLEDEYYEEKGARRVPSDSDYPYAEDGSKKPSDSSRRRYPEYDPPELGSPRRHESPGKERYQDKRGLNPDYYGPPEGRERQGRGAATEEWEDEPVVRKKEKPARPPAPSYNTERPVRPPAPSYNTERPIRPPAPSYNPERPVRPPAPSYNTERDRDKDRDRDRDKDRERRRDRDGWRDGERDRQRVRSRDRLDTLESDRVRDRDAERDRHGHRRRDDQDWSREQDRGRDGYETKGGRRDKDRDVYETKDGHRERDGDREREREKRQHNGRTRSREKELDERTGSWSGDEELRNRLRLPSGPGDVFEEPRSPSSPRRVALALDLDNDVHRGRSHSRDLPSLSDSPLDRGRGGRGDFGVVEAQQGLSRMALREQELREQELQELRDMEVARRMQEEELKASQISKRAAQAAQVAQDEEIARMLMEEDKKVFKKARDREREKPPMDRRKPEGDWRPAQEEVVRPRSREEYDQQRARNHKSSRPAPPRTQDYENVPAGGYGYPEPHYPARPATRPDAAYKGSYYKQ